MTSYTMLRGAVCGAAILSAGAAAADVTAAEVWANWQNSFAMYGDDAVSNGSETMDGGTLTVSDVTVNWNDGFSTVTASLGDWVFTENGDGTVNVTTGPSFPIKISTKDGPDMTMTVDQSGLLMVASGTADNVNYVISADQYGLTLGDISDGDGTLDATIRAIANDVSGSYTSETGDMQTTTYDMTIASLDVLADGTPPEVAGDYFTLSGRANDLTTQGMVSYPADADLSDTSFLLAEGVTMDASYTLGSSNYLFDVKLEGEQTSGTATTGPGLWSGAFSDSQMSYDSALADLKVALQGASIPFPIELSAAQYGIGFNMPLAPSDDLSDFGLNINLVDLAVNDMIWMLADPTGALPHDPATLQLDLTVKAKILMDMMNPDLDDVPDMPAELAALTLNALKLKIAGAELNSEGSFTFDNTDLTTFDGFPRPTGDLTVRLNGANALVDGLVAMGIIPQDQAMMGRMMMGMFVNVTGEDELTSKIEVTEDAQVIANGQRIR